jgi:hypothetical protein
MRIASLTDSAVSANSHVLAAPRDASSGSDGSEQMQGQE